MAVGVGALDFGLHSEDGIARLIRTLLCNISLLSGQLTTESETHSLKYPYNTFILVRKVIQPKCGADDANMILRPLGISTLLIIMSVMSTIIKMII